MRKLTSAILFVTSTAAQAATYNFYFNNVEQGAGSTAQPVMRVGGEGPVAMPSAVPNELPQREPATLPSPEPSPSPIPSVIPTAAPDPSPVALKKKPKAQPVIHVAPVVNVSPVVNVPALPQGEAGETSALEASPGYAEDQSDDDEERSL